MTLQLKGITKSFGTTEVLDQISLEVKEKEFVTLLGPSGSGKSTLLKLIGGLESPDDGEILLDGENVNGRRGHISYMPQSASLFPWRTVLGNILLAQELSGKPDREKALMWLERAGLAGYSSAYPQELSGGMQQRVSFIRALLSPQALMCLDEPFSALDELMRMDMHEWLLSIWEKERRSILFVTHNIEEAIFLSDRLFVLSSKPASIIEEFTIPFPRPRDRSLVLTDEFVSLKRQIFAALKGGAL
ncbi:ABC transporter ATP-binding protein [Peribacillus sp. SCS-26]|uniref:ABC transporter ATP-binding protein n=1 Tax=Paraperibacillus marinus TaxID=3115295 RepID=UPI00390666FD